MSDPWINAAPLDADRFGDVRTRMVLEHFKWDPQVGDVAAMLPTPLVLTARAWAELERASLALYRETLEIERLLLPRTDLHARLGLPWSIRRALRDAPPAGERDVRLMRFDFHHTDEGWRVSEVNADVPGGFVEGGAFAAEMAAVTGAGVAPPAPADAVAEALARRLDPDAVVALVHATAFTDDAQVMLCLGESLARVGLRSRLVGPDRAWAGAIDAVVRFFPAEWLANLPRSAGWRRFFTEPNMPQCNPGAAVLTQSKRTPLLWGAIGASASMWRAMLPETRDPREVDHRDGERWIVKPALGRVGEGVGVAGVTAAKDLRVIGRAVRWRPGRWIAQRRFRPLPWRTATGDLYPCVGVYVVDGRVAGAYGRASASKVVDHRAHEVAVLIEPSAARAAIAVVSGERVKGGAA